MSELAGIFLILAAVMFVCGYVASTSQWVFVVIAWGLAAVCFCVAAAFWISAVIQRYR